MIEYLLLALGIIFLIKGADFLVDSSSAIAKKLGVSQIIIGLTIVAFGTSLPELVVNLFAVFRDSPGFIFGNIIGSNIANILFVLGITAIVSNIHVKASAIWKQISLAIISAAILFILVNKPALGVNSNHLSRIDGLIFLSLFAIFLYFIYQSAKAYKKETKPIEKIENLNYKIYIKLVLGFIGIYFGGKWIVDNTISIATQFGISEFLISATVIAIGTSLPELAVCITTTLKKNIDLAFGNVIGSNIFNRLLVLGIIPLIKPLEIPKFIGFDIFIMLFSMTIVFILVFTGKRPEIRRKDGIIFVLIYIIYIYTVIIRG